jgi:hypothetical protein
VDFMDSLDGEVNRRLAVLALLYMRRRKDPDHPAVSLFEIETRMGFPREYLEFTLWYLQRKGYVNRADNADFVLLADGVDYVEAQRPSVPVLNKLLTTSTIFTNNSEPDNNIRSNEASPIITPVPVDRRRKEDRRKRQLQEGEATPSQPQDAESESAVESPNESAIESTEQIRGTESSETSPL